MKKKFVPLTKVRKTKTKTNSKKLREYPKTPSQSFKSFTELSTKISENYEGKVDGIFALIDTLPEPIKSLLHNNSVTKVTARQGFSSYKLSDGLEIRLKDINFNLKNKTRVIIKKGKKELINTVL